ncbi:hypothetical protein Dsin_016293 [Dipteronia sinensis]|uniref:Uncharacterized protein n=1 Tax=Dipteronia sinensis TaxID=43782 RepID=A0AAE0AE09_9ROSI|nr:hypothetical protein Dsin_016293 [Dipteronia sinensis]
MAVSESESLHNTQKLKSDSDMAAAAQQLMLLSDEDSSSSSSNSVKKISSDDHREKINQRSRDENTWGKKIEEIFGTEEEVCRPKKRRYRSIVSIYQATKPIFR